MDKENHKEIPRGFYCYETLSDGRIKLCPYWGYDSTKPNQMNGFCKLTGIKDWEDSTGFSLLWDQCKECEFNFDE